HIGRAGACIDGTRQRFAQQPSGAFQDERNCPPYVWQCGALYVSLCTPVCKTENRTLYQREVSEDGKWVSRANFAGRQMIQYIFQHFAIIHIGGSEANNKRNAIAIRYEMMFASRTTSIYGVGSCVFAPL